MSKVKVSALFLIVPMALLVSVTAFGQGTAFSYQGKLADGGVSANGQYDFQFKLFDTQTVGTGAQQGGLVGASNVTVTAGVFTVQLDFGACPACFDGSPRFLEIAVKQTAGSTFVTLSPRQPITSTPYAIKSQNAATADGLSVVCVNCVTSTQIGSVNGSAVTGTIPAASVPGGSTHYIQNSTNQQTPGDFNISGSGTASGTLSANTVNAVTQFNLGGSAVLSAPGLGNLFAGVGAGATGSENAFFGHDAGAANSTGIRNSFFGSNTGLNNSTGSDNAFFGTSAGAANIAGNLNCFFGAFAGQASTAAGNNAFFGAFAGSSSTTGNFNAFFGMSAGIANTTGAHDAFFGEEAGRNNTTGGHNAFFGELAGLNNTTGSDNTIIGTNANVGSANLNFATAIGANAVVSSSNSLVLGSINGVNGATADTRIGIGTTAPAKHLHVRGEGDQEIMIESTDVGGIKWTLQSSDGAANGRFEIIDRTANASRMTVSSTGNVGIGTTAAAAKLDVNGIIHVATLGAADNTNTLCRNSLGQIANCNSSSLRYKADVKPFISGLDVVKRLRPISFTWRQSGGRDIGFGAEEVARVAPQFTFNNERGQIEGVRYDRISVVLVNAIKEQQTQIEQQQEQIKSQEASIGRQRSTIKTQQTLVQPLREQLNQQQTQIDSLKKVVCLDHPSANLCR